MEYKLIRDLGWNGRASQMLWCVGDHYVVTSAADVLYSGPETYVFAADSEGTITDWVELRGSFRGSFDHERAVRDYAASL